MIDLSANEVKVSRETAYQIFKRQEKSLNQMRDELDGKSKMFSSEHFKRKFKPGISPSDQIFEKIGRRIDRFQGRTP